MGLLSLFRRAEPKAETRAAGSGFTAQVIDARYAYITGRSGLAEATATAQAAISLWEAGLASAEVSGAPALDRRALALMGRSLALRGESVFLIDGDDLVPAYDWQVRAERGRARAYRLTLPATGGGETVTALAPEVLHVVTGATPEAPWAGSPPLRRAAISAALLEATEAALRDVFEAAPLGSQVVPMPENPDVKNEDLARSFRGQRGRVLLRESLMVTAAGGPVPVQDWRPSSLSPNIKDAMAIEASESIRAAILAAFGVLPAMFDPKAAGALIREAQRHLATWTLQPMASLIAEEATRKLGQPVALDVMGPLQAYDAGGRARAFKGVVDAMAAAKAGGLSEAEIAAAASFAGAPDGG